MASNPSKINKCPRCGCTESFQSDCGWLASKVDWCARCRFNAFLADLEAAGVECLIWAGGESYYIGHKDHWVRELVEVGEEADKPS